MPGELSNNFFPNFVVVNALCIVKLQKGKDDVITIL